MQYHTDEIRAPLCVVLWIHKHAGSMGWGRMFEHFIKKKKKNSTVLVKFWGHIPISFSSHIEGIENRGAYS